MEHFFLDYHDPLFGLIVFFLIIFIISVSSYWFGVFKKNEDKKNIDDFIKKFEISKEDSNYKKIFENTSLTVDNIILISISYEKIGDFEKAINLLLFALQKDNKKEEKQHILYLLGKLYFKAGFMQKASESFISSLKLSPRDRNSLRYLTVIYEKQFNFSKATDVLSAREELDEDVKQEVEYLRCLETVYDKALSNEEKKQILTKKCKKHISNQRLVFEFLSKNNLLDETVCLECFDFENLLDLVWSQDEVFFSKHLISKNETIKSVAIAKGFFNEPLSKNANFELQVVHTLHLANFKNITLSFEYICKECKHLLPIPFNRCPHCQSINSLQVETLTQQV
jgi:lipopolysaccharide biosynthesis regulator YciM